MHLCHTYIHIYIHVQCGKLGTHDFCDLFYGPLFSLALTISQTRRDDESLHMTTPQELHLYVHLCIDLYFNGDLDATFDDFLIIALHCLVSESPIGMFGLRERSTWGGREAHLKGGMGTQLLSWGGRG